MRIGIIVDSACDLSTEMIQEMQIDFVPLKISVGGKTFVDNLDIDLALLRNTIRECNTAATTACPSPEDYAQAMRKYDACFVVALSSKLRGSYNAAVVARDLVLEEYPDKKIYVINSRSASAGEALVAKEIYDMIAEGMNFEEICVKIEHNIDHMRTLFILEDLSTLMKNGRLNKVVGTVATLLSLRPIMSDNGSGEIIMVDKVRGTQKAIVRFCEMIAEETKNCGKATKKLFLANCNCHERAEDIKLLIREKCPAIEDVIIVATHGLATVYANEGGIVAAYHTV